MANYGFIIDNRKCIGCHACTVACKAEHDVPLGVNRTWVKYVEKGTFPQTTRLFSVLRCNHCDNAPCVEICPVTALYRRSDGIVDFDNRRCIGCRACMQACPYEALYIDPETHTAAKCNYCAHRVERGLEPACVNVCPTHAIISGDLDDPESEISVMRSRHQVTVRKPEKGTLPALFYIDGDLASLQPTATDVNLEAAWNSQTRGVGHYAQYLQSRESEQRLSSHHSPAPRETTSQTSSVRVLDSLEKLLTLGDDQTGVLQPASLQASPKFGQQVATEVARRTYDAPQKGTLWGWQVAGYMWTKSIAAGSAIVALWADFVTISSTSGICRWIGVGVALVFLALTGALLAGDLDQPKRFLYVMLRPQWRSWLVRGAYIILAFSLSLLLWMALTALQLRHWLLDASVIALGAATAAYTAFLFAQAKARDFWQSPLLGVHMLIHAVLAGGACFLLGLPWSTNEIWISYIQGLVLISLAAKVACDGLELATTHATADASKTAQMIVRGYYWRHYWYGAIGLGAIMPVLVLLVLPAAFAPIAGLAILIGIYFSEHVWVRAPQRIPLA